MCNQHENQRGVYGWKTSNCEAERRWTINQTIAQTLAIASTTIWNLLRKKETTGVLSNTPRTGRSRKTSAVDDRNIVTAVKKTLKQLLVTSATTSRGQEWGITIYCSQKTSWTKVQRLHQKMQTTHSKKNRRQASKFWDKVYGLIYGPKWWKG